MFSTLLSQPQTPFQLLEDQKSVEQKKKKCLLSFIANNVVNIFCSQWVYKISHSSLGIDVFSLTFCAKMFNKIRTTLLPTFSTLNPFSTLGSPKKGWVKKGKTLFFSQVILYLEQAHKMHPSLALAWNFCSKIHVVECSMKLALASFWLSNNIFAKNLQHFLISRNGIWLFVYANLDFRK